MVNESINNRITILRKHLSLTQKEFAKAIGLKHGAVSKMEKNGSTITEQNITAICRVFNVNEEWLRNGSCEMFQAKKTDILDYLQKELQLTNEEMEVVKIFVELPPEERKMGIQFIKTFSLMFQKRKNLPTAPVMPLIQKKENDSQDTPRDLMHGHHFTKTF